MFTPQAIKDKEFQIKFRGYDPVDVKHFLEELAEEFFELHESTRKALDDVEAMQAVANRAKEMEEELQAKLNGIEEQDTISEKIEESQRYKDERITELTNQLKTYKESNRSLTKEIKKYKTEIAQLNSSIEQKVPKEPPPAPKAAPVASVNTKKLEQELTDTKKKLREAQTNLTKVQKASLEKSTQNQDLLTKVHVLENQVNELKKEGVDFKSTILVAQQFADELKRKAEIESKEILDKAKKEAAHQIESVKSQKESLEKQLVSMEKTRNSVRDELKKRLETALSSLHVLDEKDKTEGVKEILEESKGLDDLDMALTLPEREEKKNDDDEDINKILEQNELLNALK